MVTSYMRPSKLRCNQSESIKISIKLIKDRNNYYIQTINFWKVISNNLKKNKVL